MARVPRSEPSGVHSLVEHFTKQVIDAGFKHYGMMSILQRVRWHTSRLKRKAMDLKLNNNHAPYYARHFMQRTRSTKAFSYTPSRRCRMSAMRDLFENDRMKC